MTYISPVWTEDNRSLSDGGEAAVSPGISRRWWNDSDGEGVHVLVELRPALNSETFFQTGYGLARDGKTDENSVPNLLQQAVTLTGINKGEIYLAAPGGAEGAVGCPRSGGLVVMKVLHRSAAHMVQGGAKKLDLSP